MESCAFNKSVFIINTIITDIIIIIIYFIKTTIQTQVKPEILDENRLIFIGQTRNMH